MNPAIISSARFNPAKISGLAAWFDSNTTVYNSISPNVDATDGQSVRRWAGRRISLDLDQATGVSQPTFETDDGPNGRPRLSFDGSNDGLANTSAALCRSKTAAMMTGVVRVNSYSGTPQIISIGTSSSATNRFALLVVSGTLRLGIRRNNADTQYFLTTSSAPSGWFMFEATVDWSAQAAQLLINGASVGSATGILTSGSTPSDGGALGLGGNAGASGSYCQCDIAAALVYETIPSTVQRLQLRRWLAARYGLTVA